MGTWTRLCVDLDRQGHPVGASLERHHDDETTYVTCATPGPFQTPEEAFASLLAIVPVQAVLFAD